MYIYIYIYIYTYFRQLVDLKCLLCHLSLFSSLFFLQFHAAANLLMSDGIQSLVGKTRRTCVLTFLTNIFYMMKSFVIGCFSILIGKYWILEVIMIFFNISLIQLTVEAFSIIKQISGWYSIYETLYSFTKKKSKVWKTPYYHWAINFLHVTLIQIYSTSN